MHNVHVCCTINICSIFSDMYMYVFTFVSVDINVHSIDIVSFTSPNYGTHSIIIQSYGYVLFLVTCTCMHSPLLTLTYTR